MIEFVIDDHLRVREISMADADELFTLIENNRSFLGNWLSWVATVTSVEDEQDSLRFIQSRWDDRAELMLAITVQSRIVGTVSFTRIDHETRTAEIGYWLAESEQGKGYLTKAVSAVQNFAFQQLGALRVEIRVATTNTASRAVPKRLGYRLTKVLPQSLISGVDARIEDLAVYTLEPSPPKLPAYSAERLLPGWGYVALAFGLGTLVASLVIPANLALIRLAVDVLVLVAEVTMVVRFCRTTKARIRTFLPAGLHLVWMMSVAIGVVFALLATAGHIGELRCLFAGFLLACWVSLTSLIARHADRG